MQSGAENGRWGAMATISAGSPGWALEVRWHWFRSRVWRHLGMRARKLTRLSMIGFARWSMVYRVPTAVSRRESKSLGRHFLLFETNFNGDSDHYLESFSLIVPGSMNRLWAKAYDVPDVRDTSTWQQYVNAHKERIAYYFAAYPQASTKMIRQALALDHELSGFRATTAGMDAEDFEGEFRALLARVQRIRNPQLKGRSKRATGSLSTLIPILAGQRDQLTQDLASLTEPPEPLPSTTHFARWCIIECLQLPDGLESTETSYLLFSAWFDGEPRRFAEALYERLTPARADLIWGNCGFPGGGAGQFVEHLLRHSVKQGIGFSGYDGVSVNEVKHALKIWHRFHAFASDGQSHRLKGADLRDAWAKDSLLSVGE